MCGIVGFQGDFSADLLSRMSRAVSHRGPDGDGSIIFDDGSRTARVGLAHRRLSIIDLSDAGTEPMQFECPSCRSTRSAPLVLTYNGELFNYRELRSELIAKGHRMGSHSDAEVLLHLYAEHGSAMLARLNGMFAFAIYDGRRSRSGDGQTGDLFVARDALGVKPLYYSSVANGFLFASEIKALLQSNEVSRQLDIAAIHETVAYLWTPAPRTVLRDVRKVEPGCAMIVRGGKISRYWRYYDLPYGEDLLEDDPATIEAQVYEAVETAVSRQMVADVPVGAFLSGGLDSSAVVAMMKKASSTSHKCYTIAFDDGEGLDGAPADAPYARAVAAHLSVPLEEIRATSGMIAELERMLFHLDEPQADPAPINALMISRAAKRDGIKVLLSGAGGDDIFSGYRRHRAKALEPLWAWLPAGARALIAQAAQSIELSNTARMPVLRRSAKAFAHADLSDDERTIAYFWWGAEHLRRSLYSPRVRDELAAHRTAEPLMATLARIPKERNGLNRMLYLEAKHFLPDHNLNYTDKMGMAEGVEIRVPLLDLDLVDLATRIPPHLKQKSRIGKYIFKKSMEPVLPRSVIYRRKTGFGAPLRQWMQGQLRPHVDDVLSRSSLKSRGLFDPDAVHRLVHADRAGLVDGSYTIFSLMCIELWCRMFIDQSVPTMLEASH